MSQAVGTQLAPETPEVARSFEATTVWPQNWSFLTRIVFRFVCSYFVLYNLPFPLGTIPATGFFAELYRDIWHGIVPWVAVHLFRLSGPVTTYRITGSGDTTLDYVQDFCFVVLAAAMTIVWSVLARKRLHHGTAHAWLRLMVRYSLATTLFAYGFVKVFPLQMPAPYLSRLIEPYGDFSPMGVLWAFLGSSTAYEMFSGAAEVTAGALLLFRRTTTLGALVSGAVLLNVMVLNFSYDVPVKLYSTNLFLMAVFLAAPDLGKLFRYFVLNQPATPVTTSGPLFKTRLATIGATVAKMIFIASFLGQTVMGNYLQYQSQLSAADRPPLYGLYEVESFVRNGKDVPPLTTDSSRWRKVVSQFPSSLQVNMMNDSIRRYGAEYEAGNNIAFVPGGDKTKKFILNYTRPDADHVVLQGMLENDAVTVKMKRIDTTRFQLLSRGFHWIQEFPFNQ